MKVGQAKHKENSWVPHLSWVTSEPTNTSAMQTNDKLTASTGGGASNIPKLFAKERLSEPLIFMLDRKKAEDL